MPAIRYDDVADLYDSYVATTLDVPFYLRHTAAVRGPVLELMAGTGRVSLPLAEAGVRLTCVDASLAMLARLRRKLGRRRLAVRLLCADVARLHLPPRYTLALLPFHSFHELVTEDEQGAALGAVAAALLPGGRFLCPLHNPAVRRAGADGTERPMGTFPHAGGRLEARATESLDEATGVVTRIQRYRLFDAAGRPVGRRELAMRFVLLAPERFRQLAEAAGFHVAGLHGDYDASPFDPEESPYMIWVLEKPR